MKDLFFCSMGSGQLILDTFLGFMRQIFWPRGQPTLDEAAFIVTWALDFAIDIAPQGLGRPVRIAILKKGPDGHLQAEMLEEAELDAHRDFISEAKAKLGPVGIPSPPRPVPRPGD